MMDRLLRLAAVLTVAIGASACSTVPDWVDPTTWGSDNPPAASDNVQTPDLADLPARPTAESTPDSQKQVSDSLAADRNDVDYSADQLRGGTEPAAPPPGPASATDQPQPASAMSAGSATPAATAAPDNSQAPATDTTTQSDDNSQAPATDTTTQSDDNSQGASSSPSNVAPEQSSSAAPDGTATASAAADDPPPAASQPEVQAASVPSGAEPAVPVSSALPAPMPAAVATASPSDVALGFKPSTAPPLDPSVSQFVAAPIIARYQQSAAIAQAHAEGEPVVAVNTSPRHRVRHTPRGMGGPETMSGAVVANLDALQSAPAQAPAAYAPSAYGTPAAVVFFPDDGVTLGPEGRAKVREAAEAFRSQGGQGFVRVVGHSSSRTADMPVEKHLELIFKLSQQRADAVAKALIRAGVPASKVLVSAVGDSQPIYYESMPEGEQGNRRAEIFLQS